MARRILSLGPLGLSARVGRRDARSSGMAGCQVAAHWWRSRRLRERQGQGQRPLSSLSLECYNCLGKGHPQRICTTPPGKAGKLGAPTCENCLGKGHGKGQCTSKGGGKYVDPSEGKGFGPAKAATSGPAAAKARRAKAGGGSYRTSTWFAPGNVQKGLFVLCYCM